MTSRLGWAPLALLALAGCTVNPATGESSFTAFMSPAEEQRAGAEEHPKILKEFGGVYGDGAIDAYVDAVGQALARASDLPSQRFTFTVLDNDVVNAFALPGGYVYVTRGLLALAGSEAELAGVIAHEIGHVTARHAAQRYSQSIVAGLGAALLGAVAGRGAADIAQLGSALYLSAYSREQEFEADTLGVRYLARAGYDTGAMAGFLGKLQAHSALQARITGRGGQGGIGLMATHPRTADRVAAAARSVVLRPGLTPRVGAADFLGRLDGLIFGGSPSQGYVRGRLFVHSELGFRFEVPAGFQLVNGVRQVQANGPEGAAVVFDSAPRPVDTSMIQYLSGVWAPGAALSDLEAITINGLEAATAWARLAGRSGATDLRLVAIRTGARSVYRFLFITPEHLTAALSRDLRATTYSFRLLSAGEAAAYRPRRIHVETVDPGEITAVFAARMALEAYRLEWFRTLNGLAPWREPPVGSLVKLVVE